MPPPPPPAVHWRTGEGPPSIITSSDQPVSARGNNKGAQVPHSDAPLVQVGAAIIQGWLWGCFGKGGGGMIHCKRGLSAKATLCHDDDGDGADDGPWSPSALEPSSHGGAQWSVGVRARAPKFYLIRGRSPLLLD